MYTGDKMKKTEYITYRTDAGTKEILAKIAEEKRWSISQLTEIIVQEWLEEKRPDLLNRQSE